MLDGFTLPANFLFLDSCLRPPRFPPFHYVTLQSLLPVANLRVQPNRHCRLIACVPLVKTRPFNTILHTVVQPTVYAYSPVTHATTSPAILKPPPPSPPPFFTPHCKSCTCAIAIAMRVPSHITLQVQVLLAVSSCATTVWSNCRVCVSKMWLITYNHNKLIQQRMRTMCIYTQCKSICFGHRVVLQHPCLLLWHTIQPGFWQPGQHHWHVGDTIPVL